MRNTQELMHQKYCYADLFADDGTYHKNSPDIDENNEEMLIDFLTIVNRRNKINFPIITIEVHT